MDNTSLQKIKDAIAKSTNIGIVVGQNPNLDHMAAALSLYLLLTQVNKRAVVASPTQPIVEISSLVGINKVQTNLGGDAGDLVVSFPYTEGEIEKVSYTLENEQLNIIVKAGEKGLSFDERNVKYTRGSGVVDLLFVVGTPRLSDLGELMSGDKFSTTRIVNIDNKQENQGFGDIVLVSKGASSVSELMGDLLLSLGFHIDQDVAQNLLSGLIDATNNFQSPTTSALAFEIASLMMKSGAQRKAPTQPVHAPRFDEQQKFEEKFPERKQEEQISQQLKRMEDTTQAPKANRDTGKPPVDWLSPKVYHGSSNV